MWVIKFKEWDKWKSLAQTHIIYVAYSRVTKYEWIQVVQRLTPDAIRVNSRVKKIVPRLLNN